jgi:hypothetical protein
VQAVTEKESEKAFRKSLESALETGAFLIME